MESNKMSAMRVYFPIFALAFALSLSLIGCKDSPSASGSAPVITDLKVSSNNSILSPTWVTTLTVNQNYYAYIFATDADLDISQCVLTMSDGSQTIGPQTIPAFGQTAVSDVFLSKITPQFAGTWTAEVYLADSKGNISNTKSVTVAVQ
jgi:hypothetical protein